ncbi:MAG: response regulator [Limisphaerales bacterium]
MGQRILFVDDEAPIRELVSLFFRKNGLQVSTAVNGTQARDRVAGAAFDLVILDVNLSGENGLELLCDFRKTHPELPVLILTGLQGQDLVQEALAKGAKGLLHKTDPLPSLLEAVRSHLKA